MAKKKGDEKVNQNPQSDNEEQNFDEEPDFDDPEGFVDDIADEGRQFCVRLVFPAICVTHAYYNFIFTLLIFLTVTSVYQIKCIIQDWNM